jgi:hypothetical protein
VFLTYELNAETNVMAKQETAKWNEFEDINACLLCEFGTRKEEVKNIQASSSRHSLNDLTFEVDIEDLDLPFEHE